jgi:PAS domain S-box-containing protein
MHIGTTYHGNELEFTIHKNNISTKGFYNLIIQQLKADNESVTGIIIVASEVSEQVLARKKIEESEHRYHNLIYTSPYMIAIFKGKDSIIEIANDAIIETWGKGKDIIGKSLFEVLPEAVEQGFDKLIQQVYETGEPYYAYESPVTLIRNGKQQQMHYNFIYQAQRNVQGEIEGVAILANEVTPQVEAKIKIEENDKQQAFLLKLSDALMSLTSPQQIKIKAMQVLGEHLNVTRCYYAEILKDGKHCLIDNSFSFGLGTIDGTYRLEDFGKAKVAVLQ